MQVWIVEDWTNGDTFTIAGAGVSRDIATNVAVAHFRARWEDSHDEDRPFDPADVTVEACAWADDGTIRMAHSRITAFIRPVEVQER